MNMQFLPMIKYKCTSLIIGLFCLLAIYSHAQYNAFVESYDTHISYKNNTLTTRNTVVLQINDKESNWITEVDIGFKSGQKIQILSAEILDLNNNTLREIKKKEIVTLNDVSTGSLYDDYFIKRIDLKWHQYPYKIKYTYEKEGKSFLYLAHWSPVIHYKIPVRKASLKVTYPKNYKTSIKFSKQFKVDTLLQDDQICYTWEINDVKKYYNEIFAPPKEEIIPKVIVIPEEFTYGNMGYSTSWKSYGNYIWNMNNGLDKLPDLEEQKILELTSGTTNPRKKIEILYQHLQKNTRYINISLGVGGMKPHSAHYVSKNKFGDCKALTNYMKTMLSVIGIESYSVDINGGLNPTKIDTTLPSQQFNHVILVVPMENDSIWIEATSNKNPLGYLGSFTQGRYGLIIKKDESQLIKTPALKLDDVKEMYEYQAHFLNKSDCDIKLQANIKGILYQYLSNMDDDPKKGIRKILPLKNTEIIDYKLAESDTINPSIQLYANINAKHFFRKVGENYILPLIPIGIPDFENVKNRHYPVRIYIPIYRTQIVQYKLQGYSGQYNVSIPKDIKLKLKYGYFFIKFIKGENSITVEKTFQLYPGEYLLDEYESFYTFIKATKDIEKQTSLFLKK